MSSNILRMLGSQGSSIQHGATRIRRLIGPAVGIYAGIKVNPCLSARFNMQKASLERRKIL